MGYAEAPACPRHHWPLRHHRAAAGLCDARPVARSSSWDPIPPSRRSSPRRPAPRRRGPRRPSASRGPRLLTGGLCVGVGLARLGFLTDLLSKPVRVGYINGIALTVIVSQLPKLFGFSIVGRGTHPRGRGDGPRALAGERPSGARHRRGEPRRHPRLRVLAPRSPGCSWRSWGRLVAVSVLGLEDVLSVVGAVPRGCPRSASRRSARRRRGSHARRHRDRPGPVRRHERPLADLCAARRPPRRPGPGAGGARCGQHRGAVPGLLGEQQLVAHAGRGGCRARASSPGWWRWDPRAPPPVLPGASANLPSATLAAVVIVGAWAVRRRRSAPAVRLRPSEFLLSLACFLAVAVFGVIAGIALAVGLSLLDFIRRAWRPHDAVLGRAPGSRATTTSSATRTPGRSRVLSCSAGTRPSSSPMPTSSASGSGSSSGDRPAGPLGGGRRRAHHRRRLDRRRHDRGARARSSTTPGSSSSSPR